MGAGEKKLAVVLAVVLVVLLGWFVGVQAGWFGKEPPTKLQVITPQRSPSGAIMGSGPSTPAGGPQAAAGGAACSTTEAANAAKTQEFGKVGAKLEIIAVLPVAQGCHARTEAELKKAYGAHPKDIHLTIVDLRGKDAPNYRQKVKVSWTVVSINGESSFTLGGKPVKLEMKEDVSYRPEDIGPIIEQQLKT